MSETYEEYRKRVVEACTQLMGEHTRAFWQEQCTFQEEFFRGDDPADVAEEQRWSL